LAVRNLVDWVDVQEAAPGLIDLIRQRVRDITGLVVRITSPDIGPEERRLWVISASGGEPRLLSPETGVRRPRWGRLGFVAFEQEIDTNGDGTLDALDSTVIGVVPAEGGEGSKLGVGRAPVWSPDGQHLAFIRDDAIWIYRLGGVPVPLHDAQVRGALVVTDRRTAALARVFWMLPLDGRAPQRLPEEMDDRYIWLGAVSPSGASLTFSDAMHSDIYVRRLDSTGRETNLTNDPYSDLDPAWSPDERFVVYVSNRPSSPNPSGS
jgi:hypothetical protein